MGKKVKIQRENKLERFQFLLGLGIYSGIYILSYLWVVFIQPIPYTAAGPYALIAFLAGIFASVILIFTRHSLIGLGGSLAAILYVVFFAVTWPLVR